ncbi:MAG: glycosyltransferase family 8 protein [Firmicutes bacterium]|nr:glycosyltransferase family 8 protein [Bacillota bacterium]MBQ5798165.1 glycosyltransferase family 8 protein [Bacillota bacterium]
MKMNVLVTLDEGYLHPLTVMLRSLLDNNQCEIDVYVMNSSLRENHLERVRRGVELYCGTEDTKRMQLIDVKVDRAMLKDAPITDRYPQEMYYRIFAAKFLPEELDRVLYLDPDMVIINSLGGLYCMGLGDDWFAAASHVGPVLEKINELRLQSEEPGPYINSGVMLMNLEELRKHQDIHQVFDYIEKMKDALILPDQDVISALYGGKIREIDHYRYNMTERILRLQQLPGVAGLQTLQGMDPVDVKWICKNSCVIHYIGKNKPWKERYSGKLDFFYHWYNRI